MNNEYWRGKNFQHNNYTDFSKEWEILKRCIESKDELAKAIALSEREDEKKQSIKYIVDSSFKSTTMTQIRRFYNYIKKIEAEFNGDNIKDTRLKLVLLIPRIQYAKKRKSLKGPFDEFLIKSIKKLYKEENFTDKFRNFIQLFEAIVAYVREK